MKTNMPLTTTKSCSTTYFNTHLKCDNCSKEFPTRGGLNRHMKTHTRPYVCKHCGKGFSLSCDLDRHSTQHRTLAIFFHCHVPGCQAKGFPRKDNLRRHIRNHHANVLQQDALEQKVIKDFCDKATLQHKRLLETSSILMAAETENEMLLYSLVNNYGSDLEKRSSDGKTALHIAATKGNPQCVCILLNAGADIEATDSRGDTAIHYAAWAGKSEILKLLFERNADFSKVNHNVHTLLQICAKEGHVPAAQFLLEIGFGVNSTTFSKKKPLHLAGVQSSESMVETLVDIRANINAKARYRRTPPILTVDSGQEKCPQLLLERGADPHSQCLKTSPLRLAMLNEREDMIALLLQHGANMTEASHLKTSPKGIHDKTLLFRAVTLKKGFFLRLLLQSGADPNAERYSQTVLDYAIRAGKVASTRLLLKYGANLNNVKPSPLHVAVSIGRGWWATDKMKSSAPAIIKLLLDHGADTKYLSHEENDFVMRCNYELPGGSTSL